MMLENLKTPDESIIDSINDILVELEDDGFTCKVDCCYNMDWLTSKEIGDALSKYGLSINIHKWKLKHVYSPTGVRNFKYEDISEYFLMIIDLIKDKWKYIKVSYSYKTYYDDYGNKSSHQHEITKEGIPNGFKYLDKLDLQEFKLIIKKDNPTMFQRFVKKFEDITEITGMPSDKAIIDNVDDILVELDDEGFDLEVGVAEYDDNFGDMYAGEYCVGLEEKGLLVRISKIRSGIGSKFKYVSISEYVLTIIDFMKMNWDYIDIHYLYEECLDIDGGYSYKKHKGEPLPEEDLHIFTMIIRKNKKPGIIRKFMKRFETFSMYQDICPRCNKSTNGKTCIGIFNTDVICLPCKDRERDDPDYQLAVDTEAEEVRKGNYNYSGIFPNYKPLD